MALRDPTGRAWRMTPGAYLALRGPTARVPEAPESLYVTMGDGVLIAVDIYLPQGGPELGARFPAILILTPYYRRFRLAGDAPPETEDTPNAARYRDMFVPRGYALVVVDVRGTGASFGTRDSFRSPVERNDYREIADWIVAQDWSDGRIGATGISYLGAATDFLATTGHPAVKAIAPLFSVWDTYADHYYPGGVLLNRLAVEYDALMVGLDHDDRELLKQFAYFADPHFAGPMPVDDDPEAVLLRQALADHASNFRMPDFIREFVFKGEGLPYDAAFTSDSFSPYAYAAGVREEVAVYSVSGWFDGGGFANGAISRFLSLPNPNRHLLLGPWDHGARSHCSPFCEAGQAELPVLGEVLRFFDHYLMALPTGLDQESRVHYYTIAEEAWHESAIWPPGIRPATLFLAGDHALTDEPGSAGCARYHAAFSIGTGNSTRYERLAARQVDVYYGDWDGRDKAMLCFTSPPLVANVEVTGHPLVKLEVSADQGDFALHVYLEDIDEDGRAFYVTEGVLRALHRRTSPMPAFHRVVGPYRSFKRADAEPLMRGEIASLHFALLPISWCFRAGHRIRLAVAAADADHFMQVPHGRPPMLSVHYGGAREGPHLELPAVGEPVRIVRKP